MPMFDTFCQANGSTTQVSTSIALCHLSLIRLPLQEYGGTGLGLSISKCLVSLMQGNTVAQKTVPMFGHFVMFGL